jgi:hypothetical protein
MKTEAEIRKELEYQHKLVETIYSSRRYLDAAWGAIIVASLAWVLNENKSPSNRVKIP